MADGDAFAAVVNEVAVLALLSRDVAVGENGGSGLLSVGISKLRDNSSTSMDLRLSAF